MQHSKKCPNCRSNLGKIIQLPDEFFTELTVKEIQIPATKEIQDGLGSEAVMRLHRDLIERQKQVEELELELEDARCQIEDIQDSANDLNEIEVDELQAQLFTMNRKLDNEEQKNIFLHSNCQRLEHTIESLLVERDKLLIESNKSKDTSQENALLKAQLKQASNNLKLTENKLKAFCGMNSITLETNNVDYDHLSQEELKQLIIFKCQKLLKETNEKEMFKEKFLKLKQSMESLKKEHDTKIHKIKTLQEIPSVTSVQNACTDPVAIKSDKEINFSICAPGSVKEQ
ncbi:hypothetical protein HDV01_004242 [Terramyces sp. JEL0728]|nr:hypothetical protein HDV01_004242 [Terramyces sp. JEL0728]